MARAHEIAIAADAKDFDRGIRDGVIKPLERAEEALEDLADAADDAGRDGAKGVTRLEESLKDAQRQAKKTEDAVDDIGEGGKAGFAKLRTAGVEASDELKQNLGETFSSFRGDLEDLPQIAQDVLGGLAGSFGGLPAALGLAGVAAGIGVLIESFNQVTESANEARDSAFSMAYDVAGAIDAAGYSQRLQQWTSDTEKWKQANDIATGTGWDVVDVVDALASGGDKLDALTASWGKGADAASLTGQRIYELEAVMKATNEGYANGAQAAEINAIALGNYADKAGIATGKTDALGNAIYLLPDGKEVAIDAKTGRASENLDSIAHKTTTLPDGTVAVLADTSSAERDLAFLTSKRRRITVDVVQGGVAAGLKGWDR